MTLFIRVNNRRYHTSSPVLPLVSQFEYMPRRSYAPYGPLLGKPQVHDILRSRQRRTEPCTATMYRKFREVWTRGF